MERGFVGLDFLEILFMNLIDFRLKIGVHFRVWSELSGRSIGSFFFIQI